LLPQLEGADATAALVADAAAHLAAQRARCASLRAALQDAGLKADQILSGIDFSAAGTCATMAHAARTSLADALLLFVRGPAAARECADLPGWAAAALPLLLAKGAHP
jgi:hypothetical protein